MTTATRKLPILQKCPAAEEAENTGNVRGAARKWKFNPSIICKQLKNYLRIKEGMPQTPCAHSLFVKFFDY